MYFYYFYILSIFGRVRTDIYFWGVFSVVPQHTGVFGTRPERHRGVRYGLNTLLSNTGVFRTRSMPEPVPSVTSVCSTTYHFPAKTGIQDTSFWDKQSFEIRLKYNRCVCVDGQYRHTGTQSVDVPKDQKWRSRQSRYITPSSKDVWRSNRDRIFYAYLLACLIVVYVRDELQH